MSNTTAGMHSVKTQSWETLLNKLTDFFNKKKSKGKNRAKWRGNLHIKRNFKNRGAWMAQLVKHLTLDFGSGHDLTLGDRVLCQLG